MQKISIGAILLLFIAPLVQGVINYFLEVYKNRLSNYKYKKRLTSLGGEMDHDFFGKIEVFRDGFKMRFLTFAEIEITNTGTKEHSKFDLHISVDKNSELLSFRAIYTDSGRLIKLEKEHNELLNVVNQEINKANNLLGADPNYQIPSTIQVSHNYLKQNCIFSIESITRGKSITIFLLIENKLGNEPYILPTINSPGIRLIENKRDPVGELVVKTKHNLQSTIVGFFLYIPAIIILIHYFPGSDWPVAIGMAITLFYIPIAGILIKLFRLIAKQFK